MDFLYALGMLIIVALLLIWCAKCCSWATGESDPTKRGRIIQQYDPSTQSNPAYPSANLHYMPQPVYPVVSAINSSSNLGLVHTNLPFPTTQSSASGMNTNVVTRDDSLPPSYEEAMRLMSRAPLVREERYMEESTTQTENDTIN